MAMAPASIQTIATSLIFVGFLGATSVSANDSASTLTPTLTPTVAPTVTPNSGEQTRAEYHAAQDPGVDAAVDAIVRELAAVGTGPRDARISNPTPDTATSTLRGADEGGDDHAM